MKMIISFNGHPDSEIENSNTAYNILWSALMPTINEFVRLRSDEQVDGIIVADMGLRVVISRKKGRKIKVTTV